MKGLQETYQLLHQNFSEYINISKLSKDLGLNWRTTKKNVVLLDELDLFNKPICDWHIEQDFEERAKKALIDAKVILDEVDS